VGQRVVLAFSDGGKPMVVPNLPKVLNMPRLGGIIVKRKGFSVDVQWWHDVPEGCLLMYREEKP